MFRVSLLPESYRKQLEGKKKKDLILKVALLVLVCMLIVYLGFTVRNIILKAQLKEIAKQDAVLTAEINDLQQYKSIYDELVLAESRLNSIRPRTPSAVKFLTLVQNTRPEYVKINKLHITDWSNTAICIIEGELPAAQNMREAVDHLRSYEELLKTNKEFGSEISSIKVQNDMPSVEKDEVFGTTVYSFRIYVSFNGPITLDPNSGDLVTTTTTTTTAPAESTTESTTAAA